jgi:hypothetical protein
MVDMKTQMSILIGLIAVGLVAGGSAYFDVGPLSAVDGDSPSQNGGGDTTAEAATLNLAASPLGSSAKKAVTAYATLDDGTVVSKSLSSGQFTAWKNTFTVAYSPTVRAFSGSYYPIAESISFDGSTVKNTEVKMAEIAAAGDLSLTFRDDGSSASSVTLSAGQQETLDKLRASVDTQDVYFNAGYVYVETASDSNVTVEMPNAEAVAVPESAPDNADAAYKTFSPAMGENDFTEFAEHDTGKVIVKADDSNDPSETVTFYTDDVQAYQASDTGEIKYGVEDGSGSNLGLAEQSVSLTVN